MQASDGRPLGPRGYAGRVRDHYKKLYEEQLQLATALHRTIEAGTSARVKLHLARRAQDTFDPEEYATPQEAQLAFFRATDLEYEALAEEHAAQQEQDVRVRQFMEFQARNNLHELLPGVGDKVQQRMQ